MIFANSASTLVLVTLLLVDYFWVVLGKEGNYFGLEPASKSLQEKGVIATYKQSSRLQCRHRCNRNKECKEVIIQHGNKCLLLSYDGKGDVATALAGTETISSIEILGIYCILFQFVDVVC